MKSVNGRRTFLKSLVAGLTSFGCLLLLISREAQAFGYQIMNRKEYLYWNVRMVDYSGRFGLSTGETLVNVFINAEDSRGRVVSTSKGTYDARRGTWAGGVGDFRLIKSSVEFSVRTASGQTRTVKSPSYSWAGK